MYTHSQLRCPLCNTLCNTQVYDARALRVIVDDKGGKRVQDAVETCYKLVSAVHSIWKSIPGEFDDYIANPKTSGYQVGGRMQGSVAREVWAPHAGQCGQGSVGAACRAAWLRKFGLAELPNPRYTRPTPKGQRWILQAESNFTHSRRQLPDVAAATQQS